MADNYAALGTLLTNRYDFLTAIDQLKLAAINFEGYRSL